MGNSLSVKLLEMRARDRQLKGGVFIGKGAYGCAFSPPLQSLDPTMLGKVIAGDKEASEEYKAYGLVKQADPQGKYGVYATGLEKLRVDNRLIETAGGIDEVNKCPPVSNAVFRPQPSLSLWQILMPKATGNILQLLHPYSFNPCNLSRLAQNMVRLRNLYVGLVHMHNAAVCHLDIKDINVIMFGTVDLPREYKYIDFGLAQSYVEIANRKAYNSHHLSLRYYIYPFLANLLWTPEDDQWVDNFSIQMQPIKEKYYRQNPQLLEQDPYVKNMQMRNTYASIKQDNDNLKNTYNCISLQQRRVAVARATDVFGLAYVTGMVFEKLAHFGYKENDNSMQFILKKLNERALDSLVPAGALLGTLLSDMVHMRIKDTNVLVDRFDQVLNLILALIPEREFANLAKIIKEDSQKQVAPAAAKGAAEGAKYSPPIKRSPVAKGAKYSPPVAPPPVVKVIQPVVDMTVDTPTPPVVVVDTPPVIVVDTPSPVKQPAAVDIPRKAQKRKFSPQAIVKETPPAAQRAAQAALRATAFAAEAARCAAQVRKIAERSPLIDIINF